MERGLLSLHIGCGVFVLHGALFSSVLCSKIHVYLGLSAQA